MLQNKCLGSACHVRQLAVTFAVIRAHGHVLRGFKGITLVIVWNTLTIASHGSASALGLISTDLRHLIVCQQTILTALVPCKKQINLGRWQAQGCWACHFCYVNQQDRLQALSRVPQVAADAGSWKAAAFERAPPWVKVVMQRGLRNPFGCLVVAGLMGCPLWLWAQRWATADVHWRSTAYCTAYYPAPATQLPAQLV
jgi:hypothetical protein